MKKTSTAKTSPTLGTKHFTDMMYSGYPAWSVLAVEAPVEAVSKAFADFRKAERVIRDVPKKPRKKEENIWPISCVVEIVGTPWTVILRSVGFVRSEELDGVPEEAEALSAKLKTKAIMFMGEKTSGAVGYDLYERGELVERAEWEVGADDFACWGSKLRKKPATDAIELEFADEVFRELGIYVPICYAKAEGTTSWLAYDKSSVKAIGRADLVDIPEIPEPDRKKRAEKRAKEMAKLKGKA